MRNDKQSKWEVLVFFFAMGLFNLNSTSLSRDFYIPPNQSEIPDNFINRFYLLG
jgi:hypothetical protein